MNRFYFTILTAMTSLACSSFGQVQIGNDIIGEAAGDNFGFSTTLSANGMIVAGGANFNMGAAGSSSGHVRVHENINGSWVQIGNDIDGETLGDQSGQSTALSADGSIIVIGEPINDDNGASCGQMRVFENINGNWMQIGGDINGDDFSYQMGHKVDISDDGSIIVGGAFGADVPGLGAFTGHVRVFENLNGTWTQIGNDIEGDESLDLFGKSVSLSSDGSILAVGAPGNPSSQEIGYIKVLENINGTWTQIGANIVGNSTGFGDEISISADGSVIAIGSTGGAPEGKVVIFENINGTWTQIGNDIVGEDVDDRFGSSVSLSNDGNILLVGAFLNDQNGPSAGRAYIFHNQGGSWVQIGNPIDGQQDDRIGFAASISGDATTVSLGATSANSNGTVRVYDLTEFVGLKELGDDLSVDLFPNPANDFLTIRLEENLKLVEVNIFNLFGEIIHSSSKIQIDLKKFNSGMYVLEIETNRGSVTRKLLVQ